MKELCGFLGLMVYHRKFVKGHGHIDQPLTQFLKKNAYNWSEGDKRAFQQLKQAMSMPLVLSMPNFTKSFIVEMDVSGVVVGVVLMQEEHHVACMSQSLKGRQLAWSTYE